MAAEEDFADDDLNDESEIQLGFVEEGRNKLFHEKDWTTWDGGKVGGKPVWLDYEHIPSTQDMQCKICQETLLLLVQIYCPLDLVESAYHRSLYVFCCKNARCIDQGSIKCMRCQLPKDNIFYPTTAETQEDKITPSHAPLCVVCGALGSSACSKCRHTHYCSRSHQRLHWKKHKHVCEVNDRMVATTTDPVLSGDDDDCGLLFKEYEVVIDEEVLEEAEAAAANEDGGGTAGINLPASGSQSTEIWEDAVTEGGEGEEADAALRQADYNAALGNKEEHTDPVYVRFLTRVSLGGNDQVLRYCCANKRGDVEDKGDGPPSLPLPVSSKGQVDCSSIPPCERCGAKRTFEFQIMPQLLHFLKVDQNTTLRRLQPLVIKPAASSDPEGESDPATATASASASGDDFSSPVTDSDDALLKAFTNDRHEDIDWGSIDVFTCSRSCQPDDDSPYVTEYIWKQPSPMSESATEAVAAVATTAAASTDTTTAY